MVPLNMGFGTFGARVGTLVRLAACHPATHLIFGVLEHSLSACGRMLGAPGSGSGLVLGVKPLKQSADQNLQTIGLEPDEFPFARLSRPRFVDRMHLGRAAVVAFIILMVVVSGSYFLEPSLR